MDAPNTKDLRFESHHRQNFIDQCTFKIENTKNKEKEAGIDPS